MSLNYILTQLRPWLYKRVILTQKIVWVKFVVLSIISIKICLKQKVVSSIKSRIAPDNMGVNDVILKDNRYDAKLY